MGQSLLPRVSPKQSASIPKTSNAADEFISPKLASPAQTRIRLSSSKHTGQRFQTLPPQDLCLHPPSRQVLFLHLKGHCPCLKLSASSAERPQETTPQGSCFKPQGKLQSNLLSASSRWGHCSCGPKCLWPSLLFSRHTGEILVQSVKSA